MLVQEGAKKKQFLDGSLCGKEKRAEKPTRSRRGIATEPAETQVSKTVHTTTARGFQGPMCGGRKPNRATHVRHSSKRKAKTECKYQDPGSYCKIKKGYNDTFGDA